MCQVASGVLVKVEEIAQKELERLLILFGVHFFTLQMQGKKALVVKTYLGCYIYMHLIFL